MSKQQKRGAWVWCAAALGLVFEPAVASDLVMIHGHIYTGNGQQPWAQAVAISGSRIDAIGSDTEIQERRRGAARVVDLHGRTVMPGIIDSHTHVWLGALELSGFNLSTPESSVTPDNPALLLARVRSYAAAHPEQAILFGRIDFSGTPPYSPTHALLDQAVSDRPLVVHSPGEHALWLNAKALALAGITDQPVADPAEERGVIRDASGAPSGVLIEAGMELMERAVRKTLSVDQQLALVRDASHYLNGYGITSVINATGDLAEVQLYAQLRARGELTVRTRTSFGAVAVPHKLTPQFLGDLEEARTRYHDDWVAANLIKFFADGGTGLLYPLVYQASDYKTLVAELDRRGYQLMTHAQRGDSVHLVLDAYEQAAKANGPRDRRLRIEHNFVVEQGDFTRYAGLNVIASLQPVFCCSDAGTNYDPKEATPSDQWRTFLNDGVVVALGSDWPCSWPPNPFVNMQEAVTREIWKSDDTANVVGQTLDGAGQGGAHPTGKYYTPEQRMTVKEAIDGFTRNAAYAAFLDKEVGTLTAHKQADLIVLSQDVFSVPAQQIGSTRVLLTLVGGKTVYGSMDTLERHQ